MRYYPQGLGGTGASVVTQAPLYLLGSAATVVYVDGSSANAVDSALGGYGVNRSHPLASLYQAVQNTLAMPGSIIVLMEGHTENVSTPDTPDIIVSEIGMTIVGEGSGSDGEPSAKLYIGATDMLSIEAESALIQNVRFAGHVAADASGLDHALYIQGPLCVVDSCQFDITENSDDTALGFRAEDAITAFVRSTTFKSISSTTDFAPGNTGKSAVGVTGVSGDMTIEFEGCVFDAGTKGFYGDGGKPSAFDFSSAPGGVIIDMVSTSLLRGCGLDMTGTSNSTVNVQTSTGGSFVEGM